MKLRRIQVKRVHSYITEVCGKREILTPEQGYKAGWDYAPYMYPFKVLSPRTCEKCGMEKTAYWAIAAKNKTFDEITVSQKETIKRIYNEPDSIWQRIINLK